VFNLTNLPLIFLLEILSFSWPKEKVVKILFERNWFLSAIL